MKYCLKCGNICSDKSSEYYEGYCTTCGADFLEDDMTSEKYELLSEIEKDEYEQQLMNIIKNSSVFNERLHNMYCKYGTHNFYYYFRFDKYEQMTGKRAGYKLTEEEDLALKKRMDEQYGKNSPAYQQAVAQQYIDKARAEEQESSNIPHCPICNSTNLSKISTVKKATKIGLFGIFGAIDDAGKTWKCNSCGSKF